MKRDQVFYILGIVMVAGGLVWMVWLSLVPVHLAGGTYNGWSVRQAIASQIWQAHPVQVTLSVATVVAAAVLAGWYSRRS